MKRGGRQHLNKGGAGAPARCSLWLRPPPALRPPLRRLIRKLSRATGSPVFEPHVTLAGGDAPTDQRAFAARLRELLPAPIELRFDGLAGEDAYFRYFFARVAPSPPLLALRRRAALLVGMPPEPYRPHLSLAYGRRAAGPAVERLADLAGALPCAGFVATAIEAYDTTGAPAAWRRVAGGDDAR